MDMERLNDWPRPGPNILEWLNESELEFDLANNEKHFSVECCRCDNKVEFAESDIKALDGWTFNQEKLRWLCTTCSE